MKAILLAAGLSSRMKATKLLLPFQGIPLILIALRACNEAGLDPIVVTGSHRQDIEKTISKWKKPVSLVYNPDFQKGQLSSIQAGIALLENDEPFFITVSDLPLLRGRHYLTLIPLLERHEAVRPKVNGTFGHPVLLDGKLRDSIISWKPADMEKGLGSFLRGRDTQTFISDDTAYITDIDTPQAYSLLTTSSPR
ncbi:MAG: nucleotidyltransferase family protein [Spirochaetia bacterium]|jgi:CTP:molybdopterin cytidylyltransferase MocA|nr:nucleotidyltransferase family protein [Spirochaetia bacterium]